MNRSRAYEVLLRWPPEMDPTFFDDPGPTMSLAVAERHVELVWAAFYQDEEAKRAPARKATPRLWPRSARVRRAQSGRPLAGAWPLIELVFVSRLSRAVG